MPITRLSSITANAKRGESTTFLEEPCKIGPNSAKSKFANSNDHWGDNMKLFVANISFVFSTFAVPSVFAYTVEGFNGLPTFVFRASMQTPVTTHDPTFDAAIEMGKCQASLSAQKALVQKLGYTVVDEKACTNFNGAVVEGSFAFIR